MTIEQLRIFSILAREDNYLNTGVASGLAQSTVSKKIMALERELGYQLVDRSSRIIRLTSQGDRVLKSARKILAEHRNLLAGLTSSGALTAKIRLISIPVLGPYNIPAILGNFAKHLPETEVDIEEVEADRIAAMLDGGEADFGIMRDLFVDHDYFESRAFAQDRLAVVLPAGHPLKGRRKVSLPDLREEKFCLLDEHSLQLGYIRQLCEESGFSPNIRHTSNHIDNILSMVAAGAGIAILMERTATFQHAAGVLIRPLIPVIESRLELVWQRGRPLNLPESRLMAIFTGPEQGWIC